MTAPPFHRKIGGIHWFALGRVRISVCLVRPSAAPSQPQAVPKRGSAFPAGEARTRAREGKPSSDMPAGEYTGMSVAKWRKINSIPPLKLVPAREAVRCEPIQRLPRTAVFPWPPESKL